MNTTDRTNRTDRTDGICSAALALGFTEGDLADRTVDEWGRLPHSRSSLGLSARVLANGVHDGRDDLGPLNGLVGVVVALLSATTRSPGLDLGVLWLPPGCVSRRAADRFACAWGVDLIKSPSPVMVPARGLVAVEAWLDPNRDRCVYTDPFHLGFCQPQPDLSDHSDHSDRSVLSDLSDPDVCGGGFGGDAA